MPGPTGDACERPHPFHACVQQSGIVTQVDILDASLMEPEVVDQTAPLDAPLQMVELSRSSTSGSLEAQAAAAAAASAPIAVSPCQCLVSFAPVSVYLHPPILLLSHLCTC